MSMFHLQVFLVLLLLLPISLSYAEPATPGTILTFYVTDSNLSTDHRAVMTISTAGLVDFTINGVPISGPGEMVETGIDTGVFQLELTLPDSVNGKPLQNGDVVVMTYHQKADYSGNPTDVTQSAVLSSAPSSPVQSSSPNVRIGQYFKLDIYAPNYNLDSQTPDDIPLSMIEVHMGGAQTTLSDSAFQVNPSTMRETGPDTSTFEVNVKMPKSIAGFPVEMGSTLEFRFNDPYMPSSVFVTVGGGSYNVPSYNLGSSGVPNSNSGSSTSYNSGSSGAQHLVPRALIFYATNSIGTNVNYTNSTPLSNLQAPICDPPSGSFFMMGTTTVTCAAKDQNGNSVIKTFSVTVLADQSHIPSWTKKTVGFWCAGEISDSQLSSSMKYLASNGMLSVQGDSVVPTPDKTTLCLWTDGKASDQDVISSLYLLSR
ncbi:MAG: HYR domain-containing protein [Thaumarchaeota archaeon]|nr:HYR domain-containing protein [Nitrososphaerota archaeon]